jgi:hypothetical protein
MLSTPLICARDQRDRDESFRVVRSSRNEADARVEVRLVHKDGLAPARRPAGDALVEAERRAHDLVRPLVSGEHRRQDGMRLVGLVDREGVVRDQIVERVGDPHEEGVEALLGEHLVEQVGQPPIGIDELGRLRHEVVARHEPEMRGRPHNHSSQPSPVTEGVASPD